MTRKMIIILLTVISMVLVFRLTLAQRYEKESEYVSRDEFVLLDEKIDKIVNGLPEKGSQEKSNREISVKLDQVLLNQQKILSELEVVKVRATKR